jgi:acetoin utilization deacetylase AcuC-like enzyme
MILDWDVHHGNGTEAIFYGSDEVLYASIHQSPLYPGTGAAADLGSGAGEGYTVNLPVPPGSGPDEFLALVQHVVAPVAREWKPGLLCISAGYDAHRDDPLANCELDDVAYWDMAATMRELAGELEVPLLICLEGGYSLGALSRSVVATLDAVSGEDSAREAPAGPAVPYRERLARFWPGLAAAQ